MQNNEQRSEFRAWRGIYQYGVGGAFDGQMAQAAMPF